MTRSIKFVTLACVAAFCVVLPLALAHDVTKGPNGGQMAHDSGHHVELTTGGNEIKLYVSDDGDKPVGTAGSSGRVIVQGDGRQSAADLVASAPNVMVAKLESPVPEGARIAVTITLAGGQNVKARFVMK